MTSWVLIPSLTRLRSDFNAVAPERDRSSDGSVGDLAHQGSSSDHNPDETGNVPIRDADKVNEVHAIDVDADLRVPGLSMEKVVQFLLGRCRSGQEERLRYIIFNRRIWSASTQWRGAAYSGANPHDKHAHFSGSYESAKEANDKSSWHLEDIPVALTADDKKWISAEIRSAVAGAAAADVPTAEENAEALWNRVRNDKRPLISDTARNLIGAEITEAVRDGVAIERYPANQDKE